MAITTCGYDPTKMADHFTITQLEEMLHRRRDDPDNRAKKPGIYLFDKKTNKRIDNITWAIYYKTKTKGT